MTAYSSDITDDCSWWNTHQFDDGRKAGPRLIGLCRQMALRQQTLITNTEKCISVFQYGGEAIDVGPGEHFPLEENLSTFNAAQNLVETVFAKVVKPRIAPMPLTNGGGYLQRHRAKQMGKALEGVLDDNNAEQIEEDIVMDALVSDHGAGACKVIEGATEVKLEHVPIEDVWFDESEVRQRQPRSCFHVPREGIDKYVACELYAPDGDDHPGAVGTVESRRAAILRAASRPEAWRTSSGTETRNRVDIFEAWHMPSGEVTEEEYDDEDDVADDGKPKRKKRAKHDGRHVVAVEGEDGTLIDEPWEGPMFPILLYVPRKRRRSIWGLSLMRDIIAPQREFEKLSIKFQNAHDMMGVSGFVAPAGSNVNPREITGGRFGSGFIVEYEGQLPPTPFAPDPVPPTAYAYRESIARDMSERKGISTLAAASQLPAGLQQASGKALQVFEDFEDVRLLPYHRERERFKISLCWLIIHAAKRIVDRGVKYQARYRAKHGIEAVDWAEVLMDAKDFVLKVFPISQLSKQPSALFAQLTELRSAGDITPEQFKRLFGLPDLEAENELDTSDTDVIDRALDIMVIEGRYMPPEPWDVGPDKFDTLISRAGKFFNVCRQHEVPKDRLQLIQDFISDAKSLREQIAAEEAAKAAANAPLMPMAPPGVPPMPPDPGMMPPPDPGAPPMPPAPMPMAA